MATTTRKRTEEVLTPAERLRRVGRLRDLDCGRVRIPLACPFCLSTRLEPDGEKETGCAACGRTSKLTKVHTIRKQRIARYIRTGDL